MLDRAAVDSRRTAAAAAEGTAAAAGASTPPENNQVCAAEDAQGHDCRTHAMYAHMHSNYSWMVETMQEPAPEVFSTTNDSCD